MKFVAHNVVKVELDSSFTTVARDVARKVSPCVRALSYVLHETETGDTVRTDGLLGL